MTNHSILPMKPLTPAREGSWRRTSHGSSAFASELSLVQPQDGVELHASTSRVAAINSRLVEEPEDARLTGSTRSLFRRVMGLNVMVKPVPANATKPVIAIRKPATTTLALSRQQAQVA